MQKLNVAGGFIRQDGAHETAISDDEARRLLSTTCRDVEEMVANMKANHGGKIKADDLLLCYRYQAEPVVTACQGGPVMRLPEMFSVADQLTWLLELVAKHAPSHYETNFDRWVVLSERPDCQEQLAGDLMEVLDNVCGPDITFSANSITPDETIVGFWPIEEPKL